MDFSVDFFEALLIVGLLVCFLLVMVRILPIISRANNKKQETEADNLEPLTPDYQELPDHFFNTDAGLHSSDVDTAPSYSIQLELSKLPDRYEGRNPDRIYCEGVLAATVTEDGVIVVQETGETKIATGVYISHAHGSDIRVRAAEMDAEGNREITDFDGAVFIDQKESEPPLLNIYYPTAGLGDPDRVAGMVVEITHDRERSDPILRDLV